MLVDFEGRGFFGGREYRNEILGRMEVCVMVKGWDL